MGKLFILADDMTGALDTAVHFAVQGLSTCVVMANYMDHLAEIADSSAVVVVGLPTRHISAEAAYRSVYSATQRAVAAGFDFFFKKTDSVLRGNIGAELTAMLDATEGICMDFFPAFPPMNRYTQGGVQTDNGIPIHQSVFRCDPFEPITESFIPAVIARQSSLPCSVIPVQTCAPITPTKGIYIYDSDSQESLYSAVVSARDQHGLKVMAGCAGLAGVLHRILPLEGRQLQGKIDRKKPLVICGSLNPITSRQLAYAQRHGFQRLTLTHADYKNGTFVNGKLVNQILHLHSSDRPLILDVSGDIEAFSKDASESSGVKTPVSGEQIARSVGQLIRSLWERGLRATFAVIGGDTLLAILQTMGCTTLRPIREISPGVVLSECQLENERTLFLSKSGGFGGEQLLVQLWRELVEAPESIASGSQYKSAQ